MGGLSPGPAKAEPRLWRGVAGKFCKFIAKFGLILVSCRFFPDFSWFCKVSFLVTVLEWQSYALRLQGLWYCADWNLRLHDKTCGYSCWDLRLQGLWYCADWNLRVHDKTCGYRLEQAVTGRFGGTITYTQINLGQIWRFFEICRR